MRWRASAAMILVILAAFLLRTAELARVPPGLFYDEAVNGLDILRVLRGASWPLFFEANAGREPLFIYLQAAFVVTAGPTPFALWLASAFVGTLAVAAMYPLARALTRGGRHSVFLAVVAAGALAGSYWAVQLSRLGLRLGILPLCVVVVLYWTWRAERENRLVDWVIAGALLGLGLYTYLAARLLPLVVLFWLVTQLVARWRSGARERVRGILVATIAALVVFAPLGVYFATNPGAWSGRTSDVALRVGLDTASIGAVAENAVRVAAGFVARGDMEWRHNLAGRPAVDVLMLAPFALGLVWIVWTILRAGRWRAGAWLVAVWLVGMSLPTVLASDAPDFARGIGALTAIPVVLAFGWATILRGLERFGRARGGQIAAVVGVLAVVGSGALTTSDYFGRWANDAHTARDFEVGINELAAWVNAQRGAVLLPLELYAHPTMQLLTHARAPRLDAAEPGEHIELEQDAIAIAADTEGGMYVLLQDGAAILLAPGRVPPLKATGVVRGASGELAATARLAALNEEASPVAVNAAVGELRLVGYTLAQKEAEAGVSLGVTLYWRADRVPEHVPRVRLELVDAGGETRAETTGELTAGVSPLDWPVGRAVPDAHRIPVPEDVLAGAYALRVSLLDAFTGEAEAVDGGRGDAVALGAVRVPFGEVGKPQVARAAHWENGIELQGFSRQPEGEVRPGDEVRFTLYWKTTRTVEKDWTVFVHLLDGSGRLVAQADHDPVAGRLPSSAWRVGERIPDEFALTIPDAAPGGDYEVEVGWYERGSGNRSGLAGGGDAFVVETVRVR